MITWKEDFIPEHKLLYAVIDRAILDHCGDRTGGWDCPDINQNATEWIYSDAHERMSLNWICEQVCISPEAVRIVAEERKKEYLKLKGQL